MRMLASSRAQRPAISSVHAEQPEVHTELLGPQLGVASTQFGARGKHRERIGQRRRAWPCRRMFLGHALARASPCGESGSKSFSNRDSASVPCPHTTSLDPRAATVADWKAGCPCLLLGCRAELQDVLVVPAEVGAAVTQQSVERDRLREHPVQRRFQLLVVSWLQEIASRTVVVAAGLFEVRPRLDELGGRHAQFRSVGLFEFACSRVFARW